MAMAALLLIVEIAAHRFALPADHVVEVQPVAQLAGVPGAPEVVEGLLDLRGDVVPVIDARSIVGATRRELRLADRLVVIETPARKLALHVDGASGLASVDQLDVDAAVSSSPEELALAGVARTSTGIVVVLDTDRFLTADEARSLDEALAQLGPPNGMDARDA